MEYFSPPMNAVHYASTRKLAGIVTAKSLPDRAYVFKLGELIINKINNKIMGILLSGKCAIGTKCIHFLDHIKWIHEYQDCERS